MSETGYRGIGFVFTDKVGNKVGSCPDLTALFEKAVQNYGASACYTKSFAGGTRGPVAVFEDVPRAAGTQNADLMTRFIAKALEVINENKKPGTTTVAQHIQAGDLPDNLFYHAGLQAIPACQPSLETAAIARL